MDRPFARPYYTRRSCTRWHPRVSRLWIGPPVARVHACRHRPPRHRDCPPDNAESRHGGSAASGKSQATFHFRDRAASRLASDVGSSCLGGSTDSVGLRCVRMCARILLERARGTRGCCQHRGGANYAGCGARSGVHSRSVRTHGFGDGNVSSTGRALCSSVSVPWLRYRV
jgi:hypothetical protein